MKQRPQAYRTSQSWRATWALALAGIWILALAEAIDSGAWCLVAMMVTASVWMICMVAVLSLAKHSRD